MKKDNTYLIRLFIFGSILSSILIWLFMPKMCLVGLVFILLAIGLDAVSLIIRLIGRKNGGHVSPIPTVPLHILGVSLGVMALLFRHRVDAFMVANCLWLYFFVYRKF